jgi:hypothetical protein
MEVVYECDCRECEDANREPYQSTDQDEFLVVDGVFICRERCLDRVIQFADEARVSGDVLSAREMRTDEDYEEITVFVEDDSLPYHAISIHPTRLTEESEEWDGLWVKFNDHIGIEVEGERKGDPVFRIHSGERDSTVEIVDDDLTPDTEQDVEPQSSNP